MIDVSIVIRTLNESKYLGECLDAIAGQDVGNLTVEVVLIDSGSTDGTIELAESKGARVTHISKSEFTFGRSLNRGCEFARGEILVLLSGHCIPVNSDWLQRLIAPLREGQAVYSYGGQIGREGVTKFSEHQLFKKYFPSEDRVPQDGFFCNNANAAILRATWTANLFDETITGLEDMALAKVLVMDGDKIAYVGSAPVEHLHEESWHKVRVRFEREAIALRDIMPDVHVRFGDFLRYTVSGTLTDWGLAIGQGCFSREWVSIVAFRTCQFWGAWRGNALTRQLSRRRKEAYFYPR